MFSINNKVRHTELNSYVNERTQYSQHDPMIVRLCTLNRIGMLATRSYNVENTFGKSEPLCDFVLLGMPAASGKSTLLSDDIDPIIALEKEYNKDVATHNHSIKAKLVVCNTLISKTRSNLRRGKITEAEAITSLEDIEANMPKLIEPLKFFVNDTTIEGLAGLQSQQHGYISICDSEKGILNRLYALEANIDLLLKGWGAEPFDRVRANNKPITIAEPRISLFVFIQTHVLEAIFMSRELRERGFLARAIAINHPFYPPRNINNCFKISGESCQWYDAITRQLFKDAMAVREGKEKHRLLTMSDEARNILQNVDAEARNILQVHNYHDWGSRFASIALRYAAKIFIARQQPSLLIEADDMKEACELCYKLILATASYHQSLQIAEMNKKLQVLYDKVLDHFHREPTRSISDYEIKRALHNNFRARMVEAMLARLVCEGKIEEVSIHELQPMKSSNGYKYYRMRTEIIPGSHFPKQLPTAGMFEYVNK